MGGVVDTVKGVFSSPKDAADAPRDAANAQMQYQREALDYLKEREKIPQKIRDKSLNLYAGYAGIPGFTGFERAGIFDAAKNSPEFANLSGIIDTQLQEGLKQEGRKASLGGFLRSGVLADAIADKNLEAGIQKSQLLNNIYQNKIGALQGLSNIQSNANQIAGLQSSIGQTKAQGIIGAAQSAADAQQQSLENLTGLGNLAVTAFSDIRLKTNIKPAGSFSGHNWYTWDWSKAAEKFGLSGPGEGVMAHEIYDKLPEAVSEHKGYMVVNYALIGVS